MKISLYKIREINKNKISWSKKKAQINKRKLKLRSKSKSRSKYKSKIRSNFFKKKKRWRTLAKRDNIKRRKSIEFDVLCKEMYDNEAAKRMCRESLGGEERIKPFKENSISRISDSSSEENTSSVSLIINKTVNNNNRRETNEGNKNVLNFCSVQKNKLASSPEETGTLHHYFTPNDKITKVKEVKLNNTLPKEKPLKLFDLEQIWTQSSKQTGEFISPHELSFEANSQVTSSRKGNMNDIIDKIWDIEADNEGNMFGHIKWKQCNPDEAILDSEIPIEKISKRYSKMLIDWTCENYILQKKEQNEIMSNIRKIVRKITNKNSNS